MIEQAFADGDIVGFKESLDKIVIATSNKHTNTYYQHNFSYYHYSDSINMKLKHIATEQINAGNIKSIETLKK